jgi:hypothetical protein
MPNFGPTRGWTFPGLPRIVHQRSADWSAAKLKCEEMLSLCYLWEDVRTAEKLDTAPCMHARQPDRLSRAHCKGRRLRSRSIPSAGAGLIARCPLPHTHEKSVSSKWVLFLLLASAGPTGASSCLSDINTKDKPRLHCSPMTMSAVSIASV